MKQSKLLPQQLVFVMTLNNNYHEQMTKQTTCLWKQTTQLSQESFT